MKTTGWNNPVLWALWMISGIIWLPLHLVYLILQKDEPRWLRWWGDRVDNLVDYFKELLYNEGEGRVIWKWRIIFDCIMRNRTGGCRIERIK